MTTHDTHDIRDFRVPHDDRELRFTGRFLGFASTEGRGSDRWIEFSIYQTSESKRYILSRIGRSVRFHAPSCYVVAKNPQLKPVPLATMSEDTSPCPDCLPDGDADMMDNDLVYPEKDRTWAATYDTPEDLIEGLTQINEYGVKFLTHVAKEVLEKAAENDKTLYDTYYVIPVT